MEIPKIRDRLDDAWKKIACRRNEADAPTEKNRIARLDSGSL